MHESASAVFEPGRPHATPEFVPVIEQAKGIVMAQHQCGPEEAFDLLRRMSQHANVKVRVLAVRMVEQTSSPYVG
jgi:AmiR/NasT family two-component response regulator